MEETELCFPELLNTSCRKPVRPQFEAQLIYTVLFSIAVLTAALNLLVIVSIAHFKQLHTPTNLLLLSLAVSDFIMGLLMFFQIVLIDGCWFFGDIMCVLYYILSYIITSASIGTMVLISVDRYIAICDPLHYPTNVTPKTVQICVCLCWTCSAFCHTLLLKDNLEQPGRYNSCYGECVAVINYIARFVDLNLSFIGPVMVILVLYMRVFMVVVFQARAMRSHITAVALQQSGKVAAKKSELKAARALGVVVMVFLICLCPYYSVALSGQDKLFNASSAAFVIFLVYFNSFLNPLIYALIYPWFRKSIKLIVTLKILQSGSCQTNIL